MSDRRDVQATYDESTAEGELFANLADPSATAELVNRYTPLAERLALRYRGRGEPIDDLKQVAAMGLVNAIKRFDVDREVKFATYATATILGELRRHLRDKTWSVRVPRSLQEKWLEASRTAADLAQRQGRSPSVNDIARTMGVAAEDVLEAMDAGAAYTSGSLDAPVAEEDGATTIGDLIADVDDHLERTHERVTVATHLRALPDRERVILYLRFFDGLTQSEIAERVGISQMHVSRLLRRSLGDLRTSLGEDEG